LILHFSVLDTACGAGTVPAWDAAVGLATLGWGTEASLLVAEVLGAGAMVGAVGTAGGLNIDGCPVCLSQASHRNNNETEKTTHNRVLRVSMSITQIKVKGQSCRF
jgi:hypothetical protein